MQRSWTTLALLMLVCTSGCLGALTGGGPITLEAEPAAVAPAAAESTGYEDNGTRTFTVNRTLEAAGQEQQISVENKVTTYEKALDLGPLGEAKLGVFALITTPAVEIAGQTLNPVGDYDNDRLVGLVESQYRGLSDVQQVSNRQVTVLGSETTVTKYSAKATALGQQVDVFVHVTKVRHEADFVIAVGVYPQVLSGEEDAVFRLLRATEHPA